MTLLHSIVLAVVEGLTEFLPISSTAHLVFVSSLMGIQASGFTKSFEIVIQLGAVLAVALLYVKTVLHNLKLIIPVLIGFVPAAIAGVLVYPVIKSAMGDPFIVGVVLAIGGAGIVLFEVWMQKQKGSIVSLAAVSNRTGLKIGLYQALSVIPGVSRAASTIIGGMAEKLDRKTAVEFSFLLSVPTVVGASAFELLHSWRTVLAGGNLHVLVIGFIVSFVVALVAVKWFIRFVQTHSLKAFGWYRIIVGIAVVVWFVRIVGIG